jgi:ribosomal protein S18 acetylase RimI-like enzyme
VKPVDIDLVPMTEAEYEAWLDGAVAEYAAEHVRSGNWSADESIARSAEQFQALLPNGVESSDQHIWTVRDRAGDRVGILWVATGRRPGHAFIYDIEMAEDRRGEGFGTAALLALEEWARERGVDTIGLHVFGHNTGAWQLYRRLGYVETNVNMEKRL